MSDRPDEFAWIRRLQRLTGGDPRALNLTDDVAVIPGRDGYDLVVSEDAMVAGVHFLSDESLDIVARRLLRTALSDLAAKAAEPFGYFLMTAWPDGSAWPDREAFIAGLAADNSEFGVALLGGDTVRASGALTLSATVLGWTPRDGAILRSGARAGDQIIVCGRIGDGWLGLRAARGEAADPLGALATHYRLPRPLFGVREPLRRWARACADVSDGLAADVGHVARASSVRAVVDLARLPVSDSAMAWLDAQGDAAAARMQLATGGDDYALVCAVSPQESEPFIVECGAAGVPATAVGVFEAGEGVEVRYGSQALPLERAGWTH